jgi:molybdopterin-guanine dinucleotide biosynthesis protein A
VTRPAWSGILLAGGASRRFGADKLVAPFAGVPLFLYPLRALAAVCDEVIVVTAPEHPPLPLPADVRALRVVRDPVAYEGPLLGLRTGLAAAAGANALVAAGDMGRLTPAILELLRERLVEGGYVAVALADAEGLRPLPLAVRVPDAAAKAAQLIERGERRLRRLVEALGATTIPELDWARVDPTGDWRVDVDVPDDLPRDRRG